MPYFKIYVLSGGIHLILDTVHACALLMFWGFQAGAYILGTNKANPVYTNISLYITSGS